MIALSALTVVFGVFMAVFSFLARSRRRAEYSEIASEIAKSHEFLAEIGAATIRANEHLVRHDVEPLSASAVNRLLASPPEDAMATKWNFSVAAPDQGDVFLIAKAKAHWLEPMIQESREGRVAIQKTRRTVHRKGQPVWRAVEEVHKEAGEVGEVVIEQPWTRERYSVTVH